MSSPKHAERVQPRFTPAALALLALFAIHVFSCATRADDATNAETAADLFVATPFTAEGLFLGGIEGPTCDSEGNIYAVSFKSPYAIGKVTPDGRASTFIELPNHWAGNGIIFDRQGLLYVANPGHHSVLRIDKQ